MTDDGKKLQAGEVRFTHDEVDALISAIGVWMGVVTQPVKDRAESARLSAFGLRLFNKVRLLRPNATTYTIDKKRESITCHLCGRTSYNLNDVEKKYCGFCHVYHEDRET